MSIQKPGTGTWQVCISNLNNTCGFPHETGAMIFFDSEKIKVEFSKETEDHPVILWKDDNTEEFAIYTRNLQIIIIVTWRN